MATYITALMSTCGDKVGQLPYLWEDRSFKQRIKSKHMFTLNRIKQRFAVTAAADGSDQHQHGG